MADFLDQLGDAALGVLRTVAPTVATALGGPLAGVAVKALTDTLFPNAPSVSPAELASAINTMGAPDLARLKEIEAKFKVDMAALQIQADKLVYEDRKSARDREAVVKDRIPGLLAITLTIGFFGALYAMFTQTLPPANKDYLLVAMGILGSAWASMINYYYGSSIGSDKMKDLLATKQ